MGFYELTRGRHLRQGQILSVGDILELSEEGAERLGLHRLRYIGEDLTAVKVEEARRNKVNEKREEEQTKESEKKTARR